MVTMGTALHWHLSELDDKGTAYTVSVDGGPHLGVIRHSGGHLELSDQGLSLFINLETVKSVEIEEI